MQISLQHARHLMIASLGLAQHPPQPTTKADVLKTIQAMNMLQIDTIHVVARSPYLVLWSRLGDYNPVWLDELLDEGALFEYWCHAACFLPIEDYALYRGVMLEETTWAHQERRRKWLAEHADVVERVKNHIQEQGAVRSADFKRDKAQPGGWWNWKDEKIVLEALHTMGDLMIVRRENFQRVYDFRERVLPDWNDSQAVPIDAVWREFIQRTIKVLGIATQRWIADYYRIGKRVVPAHLAALLEEGVVHKVQIEGWDAPAYVHRDNEDLIQKTVSGKLQPQLTTILSPFDPLVWHRERAEDLFNFEYRIECYTPAAKRVYGYFSLPILHQDALVGRLDAKAHRKQARFEVKALHLEPDVEPSAELAEHIGRAIRACANWHQTPTVDIVETAPKRFRSKLKKHV